MKHSTKQMGIFFSTVVLILAVAACDKSGNPLPKPNPQENYEVKYSLNITGEYEDLILIYYKPGSDKEILTAVNHPWKVSFDNYKEGDTVLFDLSFKTRPLKEIAYSYSVAVNKSQSYIAGSSGSQNISAADTTFTLHVNWQKVIGS